MKNLKIIFIIITVLLVIFGAFYIYINDKSKTAFYNNENDQPKVVSKPIFTEYLILDKINNFSFINQRTADEMDYFGGVANGIENYEARYSNTNSKMAIASIYKFNSQSDASNFVEEIKVGWDKAKRVYIKHNLGEVEIYELSKDDYTYSFWLNGNLVIAIVEPGDSKVIFNAYIEQYK